MAIEVNGQVARIRGPFECTAFTVNDHRVASAPTLAPGDRVRIGDAVHRVIDYRRPRS